MTRNLKDGQWYQLPSGQWAKAICVDDPLGPILQAFGVDVASTDPIAYTNTFDLYVEADGNLGATGLCTWDIWTIDDLREATPDEAEAQTYRCLGLSAHRAARSE
jgi:hypothetical protein